MNNSSPIGSLLNVLRTGSEEQRADAIEALNRRHIRTAYPEVLAALSDASPTVRWMAAMLVGARGLVSATQQLIALLGDGDDEVRCRAAESIGLLLRDTGLAPAELVHALNDKFSLVRVNAAEALEEIGDKSARLALRKRLKDQDSMVRAYAASALGRMGAGEDIAFLEGVIATEKVDDALEGMLRALYRLSRGEPVWRRYLQLLQSEDYRVQCAVANSVHLLVDDERMREEAIRAMTDALRHSAERAASLALRRATGRLRALPRLGHQ